jgi:hypothetical protein
LGSELVTGLWIHSGRDLSAAAASELETNRFSLAAFRIEFEERHFKLASSSS